MKNKSVDDERREIELIIESWPETLKGDKLHINKKTLDRLLFETVEYGENGEVIKLPVWSGKFLKYIDLSEISFEDVSWSINIHNFNYLCFLLDERSYNKLKQRIRIIDASFHAYRSYDKIGYRDIGADYSDTNAVIDFSKSFEYKKNGNLCVKNCDFRNVDLSKNNLDMMESIYIEFSDFSNTKLSLPSNINEKKYRFWFVNLSNNDLSNLKIDIDQDFLTEITSYGFSNCINTGIKFQVDKTSLLDWWYTEGKYISNISSILKENLDKISGCYINGVKILSKKDKKCAAIQKKITKLTGGCIKTNN